MEFIKNGMKKKAIIISIKGYSLSINEKNLLAKERPWGLILFKRNIRSLGQVKKLIKKIRKLTKDSKFPILIDEEGSPVSRLKELVNHNFSQKSLGDIYKINKEVSLFFYKDYINNLTNFLKKIGININTVPVLDVLRKNTNKIIGNRSFSNDPNIVKKLGQICVKQYELNKLATVIKHVPGHGCASLDSHLKMPKVKLNYRDLNKMIFEGRVDEGEVSKLRTGLPLKIEIGAIEDKVYDAKLTLIAPKGIEVAGAIQFQIEGEVYLDDEYVIRAGYSANATIVTKVKENVLAIDEYLLQFDNKTKEAFVEIEISDQNFEKRKIEIGISDGIYAEVLSGVSLDDRIKVWNKTEPIKRGDVEEVDDEYKLDR